MGCDFCSGKSHEVLGIPIDSDADAINTAFKKLSVVWHPDKHPASSKDEATEVFFILQAAKKELLGECYLATGSASSISWAWRWRSNDELSLS